jgi:hypothetical protein
MAGLALTFLAAAAFKGDDLVFNLAAFSSAVAYAGLGALVVRRSGSLIGWLMLAEGAGLALVTLTSTYCLLGLVTFPGDLPAARQVGTPRSHLSSRSPSCCSRRELCPPGAGGRSRRQASC